MGGALMHWGLDMIRVHESSLSLHEPSNATPQSDGVATTNDARTLVYIALAMATLALVLSLVLTVLFSIYTRTGDASNISTRLLSARFDYVHDGLD
jgi:hypothetical protein